MPFTPSAVLDTTTLNDYLAVKTEPIFTSDGSVLMAGLKANGRIRFKASGKKMKWRPRIARRRITAVDPYNVVVSFPARNLRIEAELDWRAYYLGEKLAYIDRLANQGSKTQYVNLVQDILDGMADDFVVDFCQKLYGDGGAADSNDIMGLNSFTSVSGTAGFVGVNNDTYAGHSTALGALGGDWTGAWPLGTGDSEYAAWSPMVWDYQNAGLHGTTATWSDTWQEVLGLALAYLGRNQRLKPDVFVCNTELKRLAALSLKENERFVATPNSKLVSVGFSTVKYNDLEIADEYSCPDGEGFFLRWKDIELASMLPQLVGYDRDKKIENDDELFNAKFFGQLRVETPAYVSKLDAITTGT